MSVALPRSRAPVLLGQLARDDLVQATLRELWHSRLDTSWVARKRADEVMRREALHEILRVRGALDLVELEWAR